MADKVFIISLLIILICFFALVRYCNRDYNNAKKFLSFFGLKPDEKPKKIYDPPRVKKRFRKRS